MEYPVVLLHDPELGGFTVQVPDLLGCVTQGETVEEALEHAQEAIAGYIETLLQRGDEVPPPSTGVMLATVKVHPDFSIARPTVVVE
jgi:antitoxin HicB